MKKTAKSKANTKTKQAPKPRKKKDGIANFGLLSKQELRVMQMMVQGLHHKKIEEKLDIAYETFKTHRKNVLSKLKLKNIVQLTQLALEQGIVEKLPSKQTLIFIEVSDKQRKKLADLSGKKKISIKQYCEAEIGKLLKNA